LAAVLIATVGLAIYLCTVRQSPVDVSLPQVPGKRPIAVMYFDNQSNSRELDWLREGLADMLITDLSYSKKLTVLSRQQLHLLLERAGHKTSDNVRLDEALDIARRSHAEAIVLGSFAGLDENIRIDVQLHDARTGQLEASERFVVERPGQILSSIDLLSLKIGAHFGASLEQQSKSTSLADVMTDNLEAYQYYSRAVEQAEAYHSSEAIKLWEKATQLDPQFAMAYARIGYTHAIVRIGEDALARPYLEKAFQLSHRLTEKDRLYIRCWYAQATEGNESAIRAFRELVAEYPCEVEAYLRLGNLLRHTAHPEEAVDAFEQGLIFDPENQDLYNALGFARSGVGRYAEAIAAHQHYVQLAPNEPNAHDSLGMTYNEAGRYDEALAQFDRALALDPRFHFANQELKFYKYLGGAFVVALARGDMETANRLKADIYDKAGDEFLGRVFGLKHFYFLRGYYALKSERPNEAIEQFQEALRHSPVVFNVDGVEDCLANAYLELGRLDEAIAEYERILKLNPNYPLAHYHLAQAYERKGDRERARVAYERFLQIWKDANQDLPELIAARKQLASSS
jgi:tetratricopeptide (TPR) repeat protein